LLPPHLHLRYLTQQGLGNNSVADIFSILSHAEVLDSAKSSHVMTSGIRLYQDRMKNIAQYRVNLFEHNPRLSTSNVAAEIDKATSVRQDATEAHYVPRSPGNLYSIQLLPNRNCMVDAATSLSSGRHCDKLVVFLHMHNGGGTSIIDYLSSLGLQYNLRTNSNPNDFSDIQDLSGNDIDFPDHSKLGHLRIHSVEGTSRTSNASFWMSLYDRGLDFVSLEYNFVKPDVHLSWSSLVYTLTQFREPWDRFRSTYER
jgi:hypothetical protein